jgi:hypothetical protein
MELAVGKLDDYHADVASEACASLDVAFSDEWQRTPDNIATISILNLASV